jgi:hypothetical protein
MPASPTKPATLLEPGGHLLRPADPTRLPPDKVGQWLFTGLSWDDLTDDQRRRWRAWFDWATAPGGELWDDARARPVLRAARLAGADLAGAALARADLAHAQLQGANLSGADLSGASLAHARLERTGLQRATLRSADLSYAHLDAADLTGADLSEALLHDMDLTRVDLRDARLFSARITDPVWWLDMPRADLRGRTVFPDGLPEHPIQDVQGLPPLLRRQIADAQYLRDMHRKATPFGRSVIWLWGATCAYGQSFGRWGLCTAALLVWFSVLYTLVPFQFAIDAVAGDQAVAHVHRPDFFQALYFSISTMMTLGLGDVAPASPPARVLVSAQEILGYIMLGGLLSIFSNKLARLS